jgi:hypothetical protein
MTQLPLLTASSFLAPSLPYEWSKTFCDLLQRIKRLCQQPFRCEWGTCSLRVHHASDIRSNLFDGANGVKYRT